MKSASQLRGLADLRTIIGAHGRSAPRRSGRGYLEAYVLDRALKRLEEEIAVLQRRRERAEARLSEGRRALAQVLGECSSRSLPGGGSPGATQVGGPGLSRTMTLEY